MLLIDYMDDIDDEEIRELNSNTLIERSVKRNASRNANRNVNRNVPRTTNQSIRILQPQYFCKEYSASLNTLESVYNIITSILSMNCLPPNISSSEVNQHKDSNDNQFKTSLDDYTSRFVYVSSKEFIDYKELLEAVKSIFVDNYDFQKENCFGEIPARIKTGKTTKNPYAFKIYSTRKYLSTIQNQLQQYYENKYKNQKICITIINPNSFNKTRDFSRPESSFISRFCVGTLNCNKKFPSLDTIATILETCRVDYLQLQETGNRLSESKLYRQGYGISQNAPNKAGKGIHGVISVSKYEFFKKIHARVKNLALQYINQNGNRPLIVGSVYIPCKDVPNRKVVISKITHRLIQLIHHYPGIPIIIGGDFNSKYEKLLNDFSKLLEFYTIIKHDHITFSGYNGESTIDYIIYYSANCISFDEITVDPFSISDHMLLKAYFIDSRPNNYQIPKEYVPNYKKIESDSKIIANDESFLISNILSQIPFEMNDENEDSLNLVSLYESFLVNYLIKSHYLVVNNPFRLRISQSLKAVVKRNREIASKHHTKRDKQMKAELQSNRQLLRSCDTMERWKQVINLCTVSKDDLVSKLFFSMSNILNNEPSPVTSCIQKAEGGPKETDPIKSRQIIREYYQKLYTPNEQEQHQFTRSVQKRFNNPSEISKEITHEELIYSIQKLKNSSPGIDGIPSQLLKRIVQCNPNGPFIQSLLIISNLIFKGFIPDNINKSLLCLIPKVENSCLVSDFRPICITPIINKLVASIISNRIMEQCIKDKVINPSQSGFQPNQECTGQILSLYYHMNKMLNSDDGGYVVFLDIRKAYDSVNHTTLLTILSHLGMDNATIHYINKLYSNSTVALKWNGIDNQTISVKKGLRQGCPLSPILFLLYINHIVNDSESNMLLFADDMVIFDQNYERLRNSLKKIGECLEQLDLYINPNKCKSIRINKHNSHYKSFKCQGKKIDKGDSYIYLGIVMNVTTQSVKCDFDCGKISKIIKSISSFLHNYYLPPLLKINLVKSIVCTSLQYGCESKDISYGDFGNDRLNDCIQCISNTTATVGKQCLQLEYNILPFQAVYFIRRIRVFTSSNNLSTSFNQIVKNELASTYPSSYFKDTYALLKSWYLMSREVNSVLRIDTTITEKNLWLLFKNSINDQKRKEFQEEVDNIYINVLALFFCPLSILKKVGISDNTIKECNHHEENDKENEKSLVDYITKYRYYNKEYLYSWNTKPQYNKGFSVIQYMRVGIFNSQKKMRHINRPYQPYFAQLTTCWQCKGNEIEDDYHLLDTCAKWKEYRSNCLKKIHEIQPNIPDDIKISDFVKGSERVIIESYQNGNISNNRRLIQRALITVYSLVEISKNSEDHPRIIPLPADTLRDIMIAIAEFLDVVEKQRRKDINQLNQLYQKKSKRNQKRPFCLYKEHIRDYNFNEEVEGKNKRIRQS